MSIDDAIEINKARADYHKKVIDTHIINNNYTLEELFCDDTEIIEEQLAMHQKEYETCNMAISALEAQKRDELSELRDYLFGKLMNNNGTMLAGEFEAYKDIADKVERMIAERK